MRVSPVLAFFGAASLVLLPGCQVLWPVPKNTAASAIQSATGETIAFRTVGGPLDEPNAPPDTLLLSDAVKLALKNDPGIQAALSRVRHAQGEALQTRLFPNPVLSVAFRYRAPENPIVDASVTADLLSVLTQPGRISAADRRLRAASAEAVSVVLDVVTEVKERYSNIQALDALLPVLQERRRLNQSLLDLAGARLRAGEGTKLDVTTLQAQQVELEVELAEKELERQSQRLVLSRLIGRPSGPTTWTVSAWKLPESPATGEESWIKTALEHRPEIQAKTWELAALGVDASLSRLLLFDGAEAGVNGERDAEWLKGPTITTPLPILDWGQAKRSEAQAAKSEAGHLLTQEKRQVVQETRQAYGDYETAAAALSRVRGELLPLQQSRREQAEAAYKAGQTDLTSLVIADQELQAAQIKLIELQQRVSASLFHLERAAGGTGFAPSASAPASMPPSPAATAR